MIGSAQIVALQRRSLLFLEVEVLSGCISPLPAVGMFKKAAV